MTRTTNARLAGIAYLVYIAAAFPAMVISNRATAGDTIAVRLANMAQHAFDVRLAGLVGWAGRRRLRPGRGGHGPRGVARPEQLHRAAHVGTGRRFRGGRRRLVHRQRRPRSRHGTCSLTHAGTPAWLVVLRILGGAS